MIKSGSNSNVFEMKTRMHAFEWNLTMSKIIVDHMELACKVGFDIACISGLVDIGIFEFFRSDFEMHANWVVLSSMINCDILY